MKSFFLKAKNILQNDGIIVFTKRIIKYFLVKIKRIVIRSEYGSWNLLKDKFKGKRIFILGNGPSLNETELYLLKNEYTMCFNRTNLMFERLNWTPNFYVMTDDLLIKDMHKEVVSEILPKVDFAFFPDIHPSNVNFKKRIGKHSNVYYLNTDIPEFRADLPKCGINKTVVNAGLQIASFMGFSEIYLLGVDMTFGDQKVKKANSREWTAHKDDDPNHFDPRYFGKGRSYHNPTVHEMLEQFEMAKVFFDKQGVKIFNSGVGGKLESFTRVNFNTLFDYSEKEKEEIFLKLALPFSTYKSIDELIANFPTLTELNEYEAGSKSFITKQSIAIQLIKIAVFTHIPFGPFNGYYFFRSRNN